MNSLQHSEEERQWLPLPDLRSNDRLDLPRVFTHHLRYMVFYKKEKEQENVIKALKEEDHTGFFRVPLSIAKTVARFAEVDIQDLPLLICTRIN